VIGLPVTEQQVAALRAQLTGDRDDAVRLIREFSAREDLRGFFTLTSAAFTEAVELRFGRNGTREDAIRLVSDVRSRSDWLSESIAPDTAEAVLTSAFTHGDIPELDPDDLRGIFSTFLAAMIAEVGLDDTQLEDFLTKARALADKILNKNAQLRHS
jgi:hypothetical protein